MAWCAVAPSHYLNEYYHIVNPSLSVMLWCFCFLGVFFAWGHQAIIWTNSDIFSPPRFPFSHVALVRRHNLLSSLCPIMLLQCPQRVGARSSAGDTTLALRRLGPTGRPLCRHWRSSENHAIDARMTLFRTETESSRSNREMTLRCVKLHKSRFNWCPLRTGGRLNKKDGLTRYGDSHVKDKTS